MGWIISGSCPTSLLMGRVWFNCNQVFSGFGFIFSNPGGFEASSVLLLPPHPDYILKILLFYFIL